VPGTAATTGSQTTPAPSTGYVGLWVVTLTNGQTSITAANIAAYPGAPFIPAKLGPGMWPGFSNRTVYNTAGTYTFTVPNGVTRVKATVVAGGGAANGCNDSTQFAGACGGGGGWAIKWITGLTPGTQISVVVGAGGAGVAAVTAGGSGASSSFGAYCSATGGSGGGLNTNYYAGGGPGVGSGGDIQGYGSFGSDGSSAAVTNWPGLSGGSLFGGGGRSGAGGAGAGGAPGAGGGAPYNTTGSTGSYTGEPGAAGIVIVEY
jgi:hypothetical protein